MNAESAAGRQGWIRVATVTGQRVVDNDTGTVFNLINKTHIVRKKRNLI